MTPAQFQTIEEIFRAALDQKPDGIRAFLDKACNGDEVLRRKVEALLNSRERAESFIETSAVGLATKVIQNQQAVRSLVRRSATTKFLDRSAAVGWAKFVWPRTLLPGARRHSNYYRCALRLMPSA
jgi:hypothetical protein